ncbi:cholesterol side-chain cleavage enzyme, mitochondrial-like isoform X2 [Mytilus trossulus]|uniref:cholesterol side-chain cleavage enzyme, mitochondrial-like isoform X2 n=1 Tax=Mytilus trossulus TaxID=6551 RepID=UPI0030060285
MINFDIIRGSIAIILFVLVLKSGLNFFHQKIFELMSNTFLKVVNNLFSFLIIKTYESNPYRNIREYRTAISSLVQLETHQKRNGMKSSSKSNTRFQANSPPCKRQRKESLTTKLLRNTTGDVCEFISIFGSNAHEMLMKKYKAFGPVYTFSAFGKKMVFLFEADDVEKLKAAEGRYPQHVDFKHLRRHREDQGYPKGLLISNDNEWLCQRKILSNPMMLKIGHQIKHLEELTLKTLANAVEDYTINGFGTFEVEPITRDFAINAFGSVLYGNSFESTFTQNGKTMQEFAEKAKNNFDDAKKLLITPECIMKMHPAWKRHNNRWNFLLKTTMDMIERHSNDTSDCSILSHLLQNRKLNDKEIYINLTDLLVASIDTTNTTLQWCLYELACHPDVQDNIISEAERILEGRSSLEKTDLDKLEFLSAVLWETLRLHPVGFFTSRIIKDCMEVKGIMIPPQTNVAISMYVMARNLVLFPNPDKFVPERWMTDNAKIKKLNRDVFFGFGPRMCLGKKMAEMEMKLFILKEIYSLDMCNSTTWP